MTLHNRSLFCLSKLLRTVFALSLFSGIANGAMAAESEADFDSIPPAVATVLSVCDQEQLSAIECAGRMDRQYIESLSDTSIDEAGRAARAEAAHIANVLAARQAGFSNQLRYQNLAVGHARDAITHYANAGSARRWVMLRNTLQSVLELNRYQPEVLEEMLPHIENFIGNAPADASEVQMQLAILAPQYVEAIIVGPPGAGGQPQCQAPNIARWQSAYQTARDRARDLEKWQHLAQLWLTQGSSAVVMCTGFTPTHDYYAQAEQVAREHSLTEFLISLLLNSSVVSNVNAPGDPDVIAAQKKLREAADLAEGHPEQETRVLAARIRVAMSLGRQKQVATLGDLLVEHIEDHGEQAVRALVWQDAAEIYDKLAITAFARADYQQALMFQQFLRQLVRRHASAVRQQQVAFNEALYQSWVNLQEGKFADLEQEVDAAKSRNDDFLIERGHYNLAALYWKKGDVELAQQWLMPLAEMELSEHEKDEPYAGTYLLLAGNLAALLGELDRATQLLTLAADGFDVGDDLIQLSLTAVERKAVDSALSLQVQGSMLPPDPLEVFNPGWFAQRVDALRTGGGYLVANADADGALPKLTIGTHFSSQNIFQSDLSAMVLTSDGKQAVHCNHAGRCTFWDTRSGRTLREIQVGEGALLHLALSPDGRRLYTLGQFEAKVRAWDLDTGRLLASYQSDISSSFDGFALSPDGRYLAVLQEEWAYLWDTGSDIPQLARRRAGFTAEVPGARLQSVVPGTEGASLALRFSQPVKGSDINEFAVYQWQPATEDMRRLDDWNQQADFQLFNIAGDLWLSDGTQRRKPGSKKVETCTSDCRLAPLQQVHQQATGEDIRWGAVNRAVDTALVWRDQKLEVVTEKGKVVEYQVRVRPVKDAFWNASAKALRVIAGSTETGFSQPVSVGKWDLESGRLESTVIMDEQASWQQVGNSTWGIGYSSLTRVTDSGKTQSLPLDDWPEGSSPSPVWLEPGTEGQLWLLEDNGYSGDKRQLRMRSITVSQDGADVTGQKLQDWSAQGEEWLAIDGNNQAILLYREQGYAQEQPLRWQSFTSGEVLHEFSLDADWQGVSRDNIALSHPGKATLLSDRRLAFAQSDLLAVRTGSGDLLWQHRFLLGDVRALSWSPDNSALTVVINAGVASFLKTFNAVNGELIATRYWPANIHRVKYVDEGRQLLTFAEDGSLSLWPLSDTQPQVTLMHLIDDGWLVTTPQGHYDSNQPGDIGSVSWVMQDAPRQALPLEVFMRDFYEPGLLGRLRAGEQLDAPTALDQLNRVLPEVQIVDIRERAPGRVDVKIVVEETRNNLGQASGGRDLRLFRNGQLVGYAPVGDGDVLRGKKRRTLTLKNIAVPTDGQPVEFSAYSFNHSGVRSERTRASFKPQSTLPENERIAWLVTIGVNEYENPAWNLRYAANDAKQMQARLNKALTATGNFDRVVSLPLISAADYDGLRRATGKALQSLLDDLANGRQLPELEQAFRPDLNDALFITFSGHGYVHDNGQFYFLMEDIGAGSSRVMNDEVLQNSVASDQLARWLRPLDVGQTVMVVDACHSAASIASEGFKPGPMGSRGLGQLAYDKAMLFLTASQAEQFALESESLRHGFLSYALLEEGLAAGEADYAPQDNQLDVGEWLRYGADRVPQMLREMHSGSFQSASRGFSVSRPKEEAAPVEVQKPYLFDFAQRNQRVPELALPGQDTAGEQTGR